MILRAYAIYDVKSDTFNAPFFMSHPGQARRAFMDLVRDRNTVVGRHPGDFKLCEIGAFDDSSGLLAPHDKVESLGFGSDYVERDNVVSVGERKGA